MSIPEHIKSRLVKDRPMTTITLRIPVDVVDSLKDIAPQKGFSGYQPYSRHTSVKACAVMRPSTPSVLRRD